MKLDSAEFLNFRNIERVLFEFDPEMNIIFGKNAQGKRLDTACFFLLSSSVPSARKPRGLARDVS